MNQSRSAPLDLGRTTASVAAAILLSIAGIVLFLHDLAEARSRKAFDRIFEEGSRRRR